MYGKVPVRPPDKGNPCGPLRLNTINGTMPRGEREVLGDICSGLVSLGVCYRGDLAL